MIYIVIIVLMMIICGVLGALFSAGSVPFTTASVLLGILIGGVFCAFVHEDGQ